MTNQPSLTLNPILEANYEVLFFDADVNPVLIAPWDVRRYNLTFNTDNTMLYVDITWLLNTYGIEQFRAIKYIKLRYITDDEKVNSEYTFEVLNMSGSTQGDYSSERWMLYQLQFSVK